MYWPPGVLAAGSPGTLVRPEHWFAWNTGSPGALGRPEQWGVGSLDSWISCRFGA